MSTLCFINLLMISVDFNAWFSEKGFVPQRVATQYQGPIGVSFNLFGWNVDWSRTLIIPRLNLLSGVYDDRLSLVFYIVVMVAALLSALGLWTRISTIAMAVGIVTLHHRNAIILHGGDTVLRIGCLYLALAPSGLSCSLDRIIGIWKGRIDPAQPVRHSMWVQRLIQYNLALIYFTTFWHKFGFGSHWRDLTATWYPARLHEFDRFPVPSFVNSLPMVRITTAATLIVELALGTLIFYKPLRKYVLLSGLMLHGFIEYSMNIPLFGWLICSYYITFYEGEEVAAWAKTLGLRLRRFAALVRLPVGMRLKPGPAAALQAMDPLDLVQYEGGTAPAWEAEVAPGRSVKPFRASLLRSVGAWPIGAVPYLWKRLLIGALETAPSGRKLEPSSPRVKVKQ